MFGVQVLGEIPTPAISQPGSLAWGRRVVAGSLGGVGGLGSSEQGERGGVLGRSQETRQVPENGSVAVVE